MRAFSAVFLLMAGCAVSAHPSEPSPARDLSRPDGDPVLVGAGDIGECSRPAPRKTAALLDSIPGTVFTAGDNAYPNGAAEDFKYCYDPTWGRHRARTRPAAGNHEYLTGKGSPYFAYFGAAAGPPGRGYYSYDLGAWHIVVINSSCGDIGGCEKGSKQETWLREDLASNAGRCTAAYWHHPMFSSGGHGGSPAARGLWNDLYAAGADVVINGHDHDYERFAPQDPSGARDLARGIREFVVGTGGGHLVHFPGAPVPNSEARDDHTYGVLKLTLHPKSYEWQFVPVAGGRFTDSGSAACHSASEKP